MTSEYKLLDRKPLEMRGLGIDGKISPIVSVFYTYWVSDGSSRLSAVFLIINAALGAGLLNFPQAFDQAGGIMTAVIVQVVSQL